MKIAIICKQSLTRNLSNVDSSYSTITTFATTPVVTTTATSVALANGLNYTSATSIAATYVNGLVFAGFAWNKHQVGGTSNASKAIRVSGGYDFGVAKVVALWQSTKDNTAAVDTNDDRKIWGLVKLRHEALDS